MDSYLSIKRVAVYTLVVTVSLLTLLSVLSIWDVLESDIFWKSIATIGVIAFASLVVIMATSVLENKESDANISAERREELKKIARDTIDDVTQ